MLYCNFNYSRKNLYFNPIRTTSKFLSIFGENRIAVGRISPTAILFVEYKFVLLVI